MNDSACAPVALFVYNRPEHTRQVLEALRGSPLASRTDLHVFSDGPKTRMDAPLVEEVRRVIETTRGFRSIRVKANDANLGLANSIIAGIGEICAQDDRVIVLEDDIVAAPGFLEFMNHGLDVYAPSEHVGSISGYCYPTSTTLPDSYLLRGISSWGWATWRRAWQLFRPDAAELLADLIRSKETHRFDFEGTHHFTLMLRRQKWGRSDSWAIRWYASLFLAGRLSLFPGWSLVRNIGHDGTGVHCRRTDAYLSSLQARTPAVHPALLHESELARAEFRKFFLREEATLYQRLKYNVSRTLRSFTPE